MAHWTNLDLPVNKHLKLEDGTLLLPYECDACHQTVIATTVSTRNKYIISIFHYHYCPHCGELMQCNIDN